MASVDVIIPVYRPDEKLHRLLAALETQTITPERIIFVHTGEVLAGEPDYRADVVVGGDGTTLVPQKENGPEGANGQGITIAGGGERILCIIPKEQFDHGKSRNLGASLSRAEIMVFMTQDAVPANDELLERLVGALSGDDQSGPWERGGEGQNEPWEGGVGGQIPGVEVAVAYARQLPCEDCRAVEGYIREFNYPAKPELRTEADLPVRGIKTFCNSDVCAAYRREIFDLLGGFEDRTIFNEDMLFGAKAVVNGYGIRYEAGAKVYHSHNLGLVDQFHRNFDNGVSQADHPEVFAAVSSEKEGMKLVKYCISRMNGEKKLYLAPYFVLNCGFRYAGFFLGKRYRKLPGWMVKACSLNKRYWKVGKNGMG